ncbi:hypothetical protein KO02_00135 [Sphingobacterium sp. ML3W]|uniref:TonB-dependent receptor n=1 Tax=Sphingobacterium sp. ML3W TaxID=1538644 RepID=UPI0004F65AC6|nr:TonB-dependent receptor [Sphingobacterium sp. ML3W]AIM35251.1 hypothetical protein KO02_00135 [Sphingobacterium sp. ML3W]
MKQKLTYLYVFLITLLTFNTAAAQILDKKLKLPEESLTGLKIVSAVKEQAGVRFNFGEAINAKLAAPVKTKATAISVKEALELMKSTYGLSYEINGVYITLSLPKSPNVAAGQSSPGTIKGRIVEFETSQPLPGASVRIIELNKGLTSDNSGHYKFANIPAGKYTLQVSYISYTTEKVQVEIKEGKETSYDVKMQGSNFLNEVVVSGVGKRRAPVAHTSDKQVLQEIKMSQSVVSGISSQQISMSADRNAAEVVKKISGVTVKDDKFIIIRGMNERYNMTYLNGNIAPSTELYSRAFSMDLIPSRVIDRIMVYKSPAPDLMGDMTGGAVKIFTKDAVNVKHFDIEVQMGVRPNTTFKDKFQTYQGSSTDFLGFDGGLRKLPATVPGYGNFTKAQISQQQYAQSFSPHLQYGFKTALPMLQVTANYYDSFKIGNKRLGMLTSLSYKNESQQTDVARANSYFSSDAVRSYQFHKETQATQAAQLNLLQNFSFKLRDSSKLVFKNFILQQGQSATVIRNTKTDQHLIDDGSQTGIAIWTDLPVNYRTQDRNIVLSYTQRFLYSGNLGGSHYFQKGKQHLEWNGGLTYSRLELPDQRQIRLQYNRHDYFNLLPGTQALNWVAAYRPTPGVENADNGLEKGMVSRLWTRNIEKVYNGSADYTWKVKNWITFKAGTYQQWKERTLFRRVYTLNEGDLNSMGYTDVQDIGGNGNYIDYNLVFWKEQELGKVWSTDYLKDNGSGLKVFDRTSGSDAYTASEQNNAGYAALSLLPFDGKLDIYGGLRVEYNRQKVAGATPPNMYDAPGGVNVPVMVDNKTTSYLPSLNIGYRPNQSLVFRTAYGKTVNRPEFRELSPYTELDYINNQYIKGNNDLISASVNNYDLRAEWYPKNNAKSESVSIGAFYKEIANPIERMIYRNLFLGSGPSHISYANASRATIKGLEIDLRKSLDFIPLDLFRNLSFIGNLTLINSKATKDLDTLSGNKNTDPGLNPHFTRQLQGQAPYSYNLGLHYDNAASGTKAAITFNQIGPRLYAAANGVPFKPVGPDNKFPVTGNQGSLIELKRSSFDFSITQRIVKSMQLKFSIQNILNQPIRMVEDENFTFKYEKAVFTPPTFENKDLVINKYVVSGDMISNEYKSDRHFILSFLYSF